VPTWSRSSRLPGHPGKHTCQKYRGFGKYACRAIPGGRGLEEANPAAPWNGAVASVVSMKRRLSGHPEPSVQVSGSGCHRAAAQAQGPVPGPQSQWSTTDGPRQWSKTGSSKAAFDETHPRVKLSRGHLAGGSCDGDGKHSCRARQPVAGWPLDAGHPSDGDETTAFLAKDGRATLASQGWRRRLKDARPPSAPPSLVDATSPSRVRCLGPVRRGETRGINTPTPQTVDVQG
jgi:hypothetical protein